MNAGAPLRKTKLAGIAAAVAPAALILLADAFGRPVLAPARRAEAVLAIDASHIARASIKPSAAQIAAAEFAALAIVGPSGGPPFHYPARAATAQPERKIASAPLPQEPQVDPAPALSLTMIMAGGREPIAMLNGKPQRVGEEIAPSWTLTAIDRTAGTATISHEDGRTAVATLTKSR